MSNTLPFTFFVMGALAFLAFGVKSPVLQQEPYVQVTTVKVGNGSGGPGSHFPNTQAASVSVYSPANLQNFLRIPQKELHRLMSPDLFTVSLDITGEIAEALQLSQMDRVYMEGVFKKFLSETNKLEAAAAIPTQNTESRTIYKIPRQSVNSNAANVVRKNIDSLGIEPWKKLLFKAAFAKWTRERQNGNQDRYIELLPGEDGPDIKIYLDDGKNELPTSASRPAWHLTGRIAAARYPFMLDKLAVSSTIP
jgi:hypothetical protein